MKRRVGTRHQSSRRLAPPGLSVDPREQDGVAAPQGDVLFAPFQSRVCAWCDGRFMSHLGRMLGEWIGS